MRTLGKKINAVQETVEAYTCSYCDCAECSCTSCACDPLDPYSRIHDSNSDHNDTYSSNNSSTTFASFK